MVKNLKAAEKVTFRDTFVSRFINNSEFFMIIEDKDFYIWSLKPEIIETYLYDFLKNYYADFYNSGSYNYDSSCKPVLDFLKTKPKTAAILEFLEESDSEAFTKGDSRYDITVNEANIVASTEEITLSFEGKVMYEEIFDHISFFQACVRKAYAENPLAAGLTIDIG